MLELRVLADETESLLCSLIDLDNWSTENEGAVVALCLQGLSIDICSASKGAVNQDRLAGLSRMF